MIPLPQIELARPDDAAAIAAMSRDYIESGLGWNWTRLRVLKAVRDSGSNVAVARHGDTLLGFGIMLYGEQHAHLSLLGVHHAHRRIGLGGALLAWLEKSAAVAGLEAIHLEARVDNDSAIGFYRAQGYTRTGSVPGYYRGVVDAVRLEKRLRSTSPLGS